MSGEFEWQTCMFLTSRKEYEPCNDGKSEYCTGASYDCEYGGIPTFDECACCPCKPPQYAEVKYGEG